MRKLIEDKENWILYSKDSLLKDVITSITPYDFMGLINLEETTLSASIFDVAIIDSRNLDLNQCVSVVRQLRKKKQSVYIILILSLDESVSNEMFKAIEPSSFLVEPLHKLPIQLSYKLAIERNVSRQKVLKFVLSNLTTREMDVAKYISQGYTSLEISSKLDISLKTVENHRYNMSKKLKLQAQNNSLLKFLMDNKMDLFGV